MAKIRKRAREFLDNAAKYHNPVEWAHCDPDFDSISWSDVRDGSDEWHDTPIWRIPYSMDDRSGYAGLVDRSNHRSLLRDFPDAGLIEISYSHGDELALLLNKAPRELLDTLTGLLDYPLYDDNDHSDLQVETERECWEFYGRFDLRSELSRKGYDADEVEDLALDDAWYDVGSDLDIYVEFEGDAAYWPGMADDKTLDCVAGALGLTKDQEPPISN